jgi:hypothetical protein
MTTTAMPHHQRKTHYIDENVQKTLLISLVLIEAVLVLGLCWIMYRQLSHTIELNLYRIHLAEAEPLLKQLLHAALPLLAMFLLVNVLASASVYLIWRRQMNAMLMEFRIQVDKTRQLDFSPDMDLTPYRYELLRLSTAQRAQERQRFIAIRERMALFETDISAPADSGRIRSALDGIEALLPLENR